METKTSERALQASHIVDPRIISPAAPTAHGRSVRVATGTAYRSLLAGRAPRGRGGAGGSTPLRQPATLARDGTSVRTSAAQRWCARRSRGLGLAISRAVRASRVALAATARASSSSSPADILGEGRGPRTLSLATRTRRCGCSALLPVPFRLPPQLNSTRRSLNACGTFPSPPMGEKIRSFFRRRKRSEEQ